MNLGVVHSLWELAFETGVSETSSGKVVTLLIFLVLPVGLMASVADSDFA